ncbi:hypothetical protein [Tautonia plasticadhaerens]|uniref:Uncharacterized protein n=1 Tax=Tautonia plasticadhaerens TaxID=2527974 RepID=A0A518H929_9BACT|nr:hypothetical protein [Tautonia plasticadhaerens]QDV37358.1 hypothetical protein ElP_52960 [Tautonia plasticadhaerens]
MPFARPIPAMVALGFILCASIAAQDPAGEGGVAPEGGLTRSPGTEAAALEFVREHHPELADLLVPLRAMDRDAYDDAIRDLTRTRENIDRQHRRDPDRAALLLETWKARSRVDLITARLISTPDPSLERALREGLAEQLDAQLALQVYDRAQLQRRLEQLDEQIGRLRRRGDALIEARLNAALKEVDRVRRLDGRGRPSRPADIPDPRPNRVEGARPR